MFGIIVCFSLIFAASLHADSKNKVPTKYIGRECYENDTCWPVKGQRGKRDDWGEQSPCLAVLQKKFTKLQCCYKKINNEHCILTQGIMKGTCECFTENVKLEKMDLSTISGNGCVRDHDCNRSTYILENICPDGVKCQCKEYETTGSGLRCKHSRQGECVCKWNHPSVSNRPR